MHRRSIALVLGTALALFLAAVPPALAAPLIVLKLDDLSQAPYARGGFERVFRLLKKRNVSASFGVITNSCAEGAAPADYFPHLRRWAESGRVELWHHGWNHERGEFKGSGAPLQARHLADGIAAVRQATGIELSTFGAPFNETDADTITALQKTPTIRVWFAPEATARAAGLVALDQRAPMESKVGVVSYELFIESFGRQLDASYLVVLGHPPYWNEDSHHAFDRIVQFCLARGCRFVTATQAAAELRQ